MSAPPLPTRHIIHTKGLRYLVFAGPAAVLSGVAWYVFYTEPRRMKYVNYFKNYDPYVRMEEICAYPVKFMHTCPSVLLKRLEEKGMHVQPTDNVYHPPKSLRPPPAEQVQQIPSLPVA